MKKMFSLNIQLVEMCTHLDEGWDDGFEELGVRMGALNVQKQMESAESLAQDQLRADVHQFKQTFSSMSTSERSVITSSVTAATFSDSGSATLSEKLRPSICWLV